MELSQIMRDSIKVFNNSRIEYGLSFFVNKEGGIEYFYCYKGTEDYTRFIYPRKRFAYYGVSLVVLIHNHPIYAPWASSLDIESTKSIKRKLRLIKPSLFIESFIYSDNKIVHYVDDKKSNYVLPVNKERFICCS